MDAKLFSDRSINLSGKGLSILLAAGLLLVAFLLDLQAGRSLFQGMLLPLGVCAALTAAVGSWAVPALRALKAGQIIREDGPQAHLKKAGTPTMGGVFFIPVAVLIAVLWSGFDPNVIAVSALTLSYAAIGLLDDWQIIRRKSNKGISPRMKLSLQVLFGALFCLWMAQNETLSFDKLVLPFGWVLPLGFLFLPIALFSLVAESNATNLTDGLDGLAGGTVAISLLGLSALVAPTSPSLMIFCACLSGSCLGFLSHNRHPARVFMGDTGALALGGALAAVALLTQNLFALLILSGLFLVETLSVMAQVSYYKATKGSDGIGRRLFKMSPFHNHLELSGWSEIQIVGTFYLVGLFLVFFCLAIYA
ncbi:MAG: phospho-N-acetylmuramoyl-pentapeptide-transferase [Scytolyngbya sp. HA4215-MV1]|nr:phospho-N-acetylmuramoyl-pentapeptide-transferase [Scytolyngbya sp. HA4215-MV1]